MKIFNEISTITEPDNEFEETLVYSGLSILLRVLAPITPHICHVLWTDLGFNKIIIDAPWPKCDKNALKTDDALFVIQVNGKKRGEIKASLQLNEDELLQLAHQEVNSFLVDKTIMKSIVVAHRHLINLVIRD